MRVLKMALAGLVGFSAYMLVGQRPLALAMLSKASGGDQPCPWSVLARYPWAMEKFTDAQSDVARQLRVEREDAALGIELLRTPGRAFWIKKTGRALSGRATLAYVLAEQDWIGSYAGSRAVQPGMVVIDVGAHVGTFGDDALRRGAAKVIMVEPDPVNVECLRRNFAEEIAAGRVVVAPEGAWNSHSTLEFSTGVANSGTGSFVVRETGSNTIAVPVRPLDEIVAELRAGRIDYIKMDIEGAEREALTGARETLRRSKPILMLDHYHLPDDDVVLPRLIREANPEYRASCDLCSPDRLSDSGRFVPYIVFYR